MACFKLGVCGVFYSTPASVQACKIKLVVNEVESEPMMSRTGSGLTAWIAYTWQELQHLGIPGGSLITSES